MAAACASSCLRETGEPMIVLRCRRGRDDEYRGGGRVGKEERPGRQGKRGRRSPLPTRVLQGFATPRTTRSSLPLLSGITNRYRSPLSSPPLALDPSPSATLRFLDLVLTGALGYALFFSSSPRMPRFVCEHAEPAAVTIVHRANTR